PPRAEPSPHGARAPTRRDGSGDVQGSRRRRFRRRRTRPRRRAHGRDRRERDRDVGAASGRSRNRCEGRLRGCLREIRVLPMNAASRTQAQARYRELPLPDTAEEHWRFTDLTGFDPDAFEKGSDLEGHTLGTDAAILDLDAAGLATISEAGVTIERAPDGITFAPLDEDHELLYSLVGWDEKFAAHNAALWQRGLLVVVPKGVVLDKPLYVRVTNSNEGGSLLWRLLVVAEEGARFTLVEEAVSATPDLHGYTNAAEEFFLGP